MAMPFAVIFFVSDIFRFLVSAVFPPARLPLPLIVSVRGLEAPMVGVFGKTEETTMKLITRHELSKLTLTELRGLYSHVFNALAQSQRKRQRRNALASLETIQHELHRSYTMNSPLKGLFFTR
jgi:hypothetical protein